MPETRKPQSLFEKAPLAPGAIPLPVAYGLLPMRIAVDEQGQRDCGDHQQHDQAVSNYQACFDELSPGSREAGKNIIRHKALTT